MASSSTNAPKQDLSLLEDDDEFEEFPVEGNRTDRDSCLRLGPPNLFQTSDWTEKEENHGDQHVWEENWDDDNVEDDFSQQLRYIKPYHLDFD